MSILIKNSQKSIRLNQQRIRKDLGKALRLLGLQTSELSIMFVGNRLMTRLNSLYRGFNRTTDVLSFPLDNGRASGPTNLLGDIVVCIPKAVSQSKEYDVPFYDELLRLLIHGLLHLIGYDHEKNASQKAKMEKKERDLLNAVQEMD